MQGRSICRNQAVVENTVYSGICGDGTESHFTVGNTSIGLQYIASVDNTRVVPYTAMCTHSGLHTTIVHSSGVCA